MTSFHTLSRALRALCSVFACALAAACGGGGGEARSPQSAPDTAVFAFRMEGAGPEQEFRLATSDPAFIAQARAQLKLPIASRKLFPAGPIAAGNGGVNLDWGWHYTNASLAEVAIEVCDGSPSLVQADLAYWLGTVRSFCPWGAYVHAELSGIYPLRDFAMGQVREIAQEALRIEFKDVSDSRCPAAAACVAAVGVSFARVDLLVSKGAGEPQLVEVTSGAGARDRQAQAFGYRFTLDALEPYPQTGPWPKSQYRAQVTVTRL